MEINIFDYNKENKPENTYDIIFSDPPWKQSKGNKRKVRPNQGKSLDYSTMSMEDIKAVQQQVINLTSQKHDIFLWTIDKYLHEAELMMKELGYELHARFIWDKENGVAPAFTVRFAHEYLLWFYKKGNILMPEESVRGKFTTVMREKATIHSKKPNCAYEMIEAMFPGKRKLEMFARSTRIGWDAWGNQVGILDNNNQPAVSYKLTAIVSPCNDTSGNHDYHISFESDTIDGVVEQANIENVLKKAVNILGYTEDVFVDYSIEENGEYFDSDSCHIQLGKNEEFILTPM